MGYGRPVWAEIDLSAVRHNMRGIQSLLKKGTRFCPVVKADGYGHGAVAIANEAIKLGADYLAVAILQEAISLREAGITTPILILGYTPPEQAVLVVGNDLTQTVYTKDQVSSLSSAAKTLNKTATIHVKIDTGMTRLGIRPEEAADFIVYASQLPKLVVEGAFTHFATADSTSKDSTRKQFALFMSALKSIEVKGISIPIRHCANSAATLDLPEMHLDMVRPGIILYGLWPSDETSQPITLHPAMKLKARFSMVKNVKKGVAVSYGATYITPHDSVLATIPIGYADGYTRMLTGKAHVLVLGKKVPVVGRICMDQCIADVTGISGVQEGVEVLLFGEKALPADELAEQLGTINYEIVCMVGKRVPRLYRH